MTGSTEWIFLILAGTAAGIIGTAGGITSLASYPALLAVGISPLAANLSNSVALVASGFSGASRSRPELVGHSKTVKRWMLQTVLFSAVGALLLVTTPPGVFNDIVPFLVASGALTLLAQPRISAWQAKRDRQLGAWGAAVFGALVAIYNGYFGAGSGILMITLMLFTAEPALHRANALKNLLLFVADLIPAVIFSFSGRVVWSAVWPLAVGALIGGAVGPSVARRVPPGVLRVLIGLCGLGLAVWLLIDL